MPFTELININELSKSLKELFKDKNPELAESIYARWKEADWRDLENNYRKRLENFYGFTRVLGKNEKIPLEGIYTDLYVLDKLSAHRRFNIFELREDPGKLSNVERKHGLEVVKHFKNNRLFILGKPGAGKTTFLKYITMQGLKGQIQKLPIFVSLKEWADSKKELMAFIKERFEECNFPNAEVFIELVLKKGHAIVLFDGLDEVQQENGQREKQIQALKDFSRQYLLSPCLITCRIAATDYSFEQFTYVEVADFTDEQKENYASNWFKDEPEKLEKFLEGFQEDKHQGLRELGSVPLLLSLLCLHFEETMTFPERRAELYEEAIDALLKKWDSSRSIQRDTIYHGLSVNAKRNLLANIAAETFQNKEYFIEQAHLEKKVVAYLKKLPPSEHKEVDIDGEVVLKSIEAQHGIFVERAHKIYSFSHLIFQEYFTARYIVENDLCGTLQKLMSHISNFEWREIFLLVASLMDTSDEFFYLLKLKINELVEKDNQLTRILTIASEKADITIRKSKATYNLLAIRSLYIYFLSNFKCDKAKEFTQNVVFDLREFYSFLIGIGLKEDVCKEIFTIEQLHPIAQTANTLEKIGLTLISLSEEQLEILNKYFMAHMLLLDCLALASVSDRESIRETLLLPPPPIIFPQKMSYSLLMPKKIRTALKQYLDNFNDYIFAAKGKEINFEVNFSKNGLSLEIEYQSELELDEIVNYLNEYMQHIKSGIDNLHVNFEKKDATIYEQKMLIIDLRNEIRNLETKLEMKSVKIEKLQEIIDEFRKFRSAITQMANRPVQVIINQSATQHQTYLEENNMQDVYKNKGQVGAMGNNANATNNTFQQMWQEEGSNIDISSLINELALLREEMRRKAVTPEHDMAVGEVASAEKAGKSDDAPKMLEHLKNAGVWTLECARDIGVDVAAEVIKKTLDM